MSGRLEQHDPRSTIIFYRSHLGGLGNLLDTILVHRDANKKDLVVQSDLSSTNLISHSDLVARLQISFAGCASHARRPFALHVSDEPEICEWILHSFKGLAIYEHQLDLAGRNKENTLAVRSSDGQQMWEMIHGCCELLTKKWSNKTPLGEGARYVLRHYDKLTYYLRDHRLLSSNNFSERMLRMEKLIRNNALFRQTLGGRFALDIVRTVLQTATAAHANLEAYLTWVMKMPEEAVAASPEEFTPKAFIGCGGAVAPSPTFT